MEEKADRRVVALITRGGQAGPARLLLEPEGTGCRLPEFRFLPDDDGRVRAPGLRAAAAEIDRLRAELRQTRLDYAALEASSTSPTEAFHSVQGREAGRVRAAAAKIDRLRAEARQTRLDYAALEAVITASTTGIAPRSVVSRPRTPNDNSRTECPTFRSGINAHFGTLIALARCSET